MPKVKLKSNLVHTYVEGDSFKNIFGGITPSQFGQIVHIAYMSPTMTYRWPWMKNQWELSNAMGTIGYYKTLREAKEAALEQWPSCWFKTPAQYRKET